MCFRTSLRGIKHFCILVSTAKIGISSTLHVTDWIKHKILKWTPHGVSAFADSLQGIKSLEMDIKEFQGVEPNLITSIDVPGDEVIARGIVKDDTNLGGCTRALHTQEILPNPPRMHWRNDQLN